MIKNLIGTHMFPGDIKITVEEIDEQKCKVNIDTDNVNFKSWDLPKGFNGSGSGTNYRARGEKYYNVPCIYLMKDTAWWIHLATIGKSHYDYKIVKFPHICMKEWASDFITGFGLVIDALVKDKYIPIELMDDKKVKEMLEAKELLPSEIAKYNWQIRRAYLLQNEDVNHYINIAGTCPLCKTYTCSKCPLDNIGDNCNDVGSTWRRCRNAPDRIKLVEACDAMIDRLDDAIVKERKIKQKSKQIIKELFNGSKTSAFPYLYSGRAMDHSSDWGNINEFSCKLGIWPTTYQEALRTLDEQLKPEYHNVMWRNIESPTLINMGDTFMTEELQFKIGDRVKTTAAYNALDHDGFSGVVTNVWKLDDSYTYWLNTDKPTIYKTGCHAMSIMKDDGILYNWLGVGWLEFDESKGDNMEERLFNGMPENVESIKYKFGDCEVKISKSKMNDQYFGFTSKYDVYILDIDGINAKLNDYKNKYQTSKTTLMTREEMFELLNEGKLLPAEICKQKYERFKQYCIENMITNAQDFRIKRYNGVSTCALCEFEYENDCKKCSLKCIGEQCIIDSAYDRMDTYRGTNHDKFIKLINNMIEALDRAIEYEKKITHIYTRDEMIKIYNEGKLIPVELSLEIWRQKENYVRLHRNVISFNDISNQNPDSVENCPLCYHYRCCIGNTCKGCVLDKMDDNCTKANTTFNKVADYRGKNHDEFLEHVHNMVVKLEEAVEFEKAEKSKNYLVEIPNYYNNIYLPNDVKIHICCLSDNAFKLYVYAKNDRDIWKYIQFKNKSTPMCMWKDKRNKYNWYMAQPFIEEYMPEIDKRKFDEGCFNNGIELSREGTQILVTAIKLMCEAV